MAKDKKSQNTLVKKDTERLGCRLTDEERLEFSDMMADAQQALEAAEANKKSLVKQLNAEIEQAKARRDKLTNIVASRTEYREINIEIHFNYDTGKVSKIRTDTGELYQERPMTEKEKQRSLLDEIESDKEE